VALWLATTFDWQPARNRGLDSSVRGTTNGMRLIGRLIANTIAGLVLLFLTNLFLFDDLPVNLLTLVICAIGGVAGWLLILVLHLLGVAF
jgi:F0F1-type ATP synthase assembly protein I